MIDVHDNLKVSIVTRLLLIKQIIIIRLFIIKLIMLARIKIRRLIRSIMVRRIPIKASRLSKDSIMITRTSHMKKSLLTLLTSSVFILSVATAMYPFHLKQDFTSICVTAA